MAWLSQESLCGPRALLLADAHGDSDGDDGGITAVRCRPEADDLHLLRELLVAVMENNMYITIKVVEDDG